MHKIRDTKTSTVKQLQNISRNLQEKFKCYVTAQVVSQAHPGYTLEVSYGVYIESDGQSTHYFMSWSELLQFYHKLMNEETSNE